MGGVHNTDDPNRVLSYILEEQHILLETCWGDFKSIRLYNQEDDKVANTITANTLSMRITIYTLHAYIILLNCLAGLLNTRGWEDY